MAHDRERDARFPGRRLRRGGDGIHARLQRLGRVEKLGEPGRAARVRTEQIQKGGLFRDDALGVRGFPTLRTQQQETVAIGVFSARLGEDAKERFARLRGEIHGVGQRVANRRRATHVRQRRGASANLLLPSERERRVEVQAETRGDGGDQLRVVSRRTPMESPGSYAPPAPAAVRSNSA